MDGPEGMTSLLAFTSQWSAPQFELDSFKSPRVTVDIWRFPELGVPVNHPFIDEFSIINHLFWCTPIHGDPPYLSWSLELHYENLRDVMLTSGSTLRFQAALPSYASSAKGSILWGLHPRNSKWVTTILYICIYIYVYIIYYILQKIIEYHTHLLKILLAHMVVGYYSVRSHMYQRC